MAYSELIKDFSGIREYMREFYVYGFRKRGEYDAKSARSYDNERRRVESWLGKYMSFRRDASGKNVFISADSRTIPANPLYAPFKAKSFTDKDITLHFCVLDILEENSRLTLKEIIAEAEADYLSRFDKAFDFDESTLRKKLKEYVQAGLLTAEKAGREVVYSRVHCGIKLENIRDAVLFFSEVDPLGVVGSFMLDKYDAVPQIFRCKHNYILHALESEVLCGVIEAINDKLIIEFALFNTRRGRPSVQRVFPVKIYVSVQNGRRYLLAYSYRHKDVAFYRIDSIKSVKMLEREKEYAALTRRAGRFAASLWGVSGGRGFSLDHIEMTLSIGDDEGYILQRLDREKRCGRVERIDRHSCRFTADVYDASEMLPWIRTFTGRIIGLECSNPKVTETFRADLNSMYELYGGAYDTVF